MWSPCVIGSPVPGCSRNLQQSQLQWDVARWWGCTACCSLHASSKVTQRPAFQLYFIRFSNWLKIIAPWDSFKGFLCVWEEVLLEFDPFFQTDDKSASVCRHTRHGWRGQLPALCIKALDVLLGVILVYTFTFSFILFFWQPANYVKVWTRSWVKYCHFPDLWPCGIAVIWTGVL